MTVEVAGVVAPAVQIEVVAVRDGGAATVDGIDPPSPTVDRSGIFPGSSEMARLMRAHDWALTPIGEPETWPESLRTAVGVCLESRFPIVLWWGPDLTLLYNDAYLPILGKWKHPGSLGRAGREVWAEIWPTIGPMLEGVMGRGEATWSDDLLLAIDRRGFPEEGYFTFSYSPIREGGEVRGIFCAVAETTARVRSERRLALLRDLSADPQRDVISAARLAIGTVAAAGSDVTLAAAFLHDDDGTLGEAILGRPPLAAADAQRLRRVARVVARSGRPEWVSLGAEPGGEAMVLPMPDAAGGGVDVLALGRNPDIGRDADYEAFFTLVATHVATELASARSHEAEIRRADVLAELDRAKTVFFTNVSHEFRTPLTLIDAPLKEIADDPGLDPEHRERIELAQRASGRLRRLVNTLLEFSRIEAGTSRPELQPLDIVTAAEEVASVFRSAFDQAGLRLDVRREGRRRIVSADPDMVEKILLNLVSNAFKFTERGGVTITVGAADGGATVRIADTGIGIARADQARVFDRFARLDAAWARSKEGSGIGLALAAELARLQAGSLEVDSEPGRGTTFTLRLPLASGRAAAERVAPAERTTFADEAAAWVDAERPSHEAPPGLTDIGTRPERVLVVDDNADMNAYIARVLGRHWAVEVERDGLRALDRIRRRPPDLVLADVMMPGIDGLELVRRIRADGELRTLPVMLLSARAGDEARAEALAAGADQYLLKPFAAADLVVRVAGRLERERARRERSDALDRSRADLTELVDRFRENERELVTALQVKDDFLGMVSHELRTPVTTIRGNAELLLSHANELDPTVLHETFGDIAAEADRLNRVIDNLLLLAKVGNDRLEPEPVLVNHVVDQVAAAARRESPGRRIRVRTEPGLLASANFGAIEQVVKNLLSNALKYSPPRSEVRIEARRVANLIEVAVVDHGLGLSANDVERIFEPFFRSKRTERIAGVGIGLTVARRLTEVVGGSIRAERRRRGASFILTLPTLDPEAEEH